MTPSDELRAAATKLRTLAKAATPGPWCFYLDDLWQGDTEVLAAYDALAARAAAGTEVQWPYGAGSGHLFHGDPVRSEDAEFIATMDPGLALALADWLDAEVANDEEAGRESFGVSTKALAVARVVDGGVL